MEPMGRQAAPPIESFGGRVRRVASFGVSTAVRILRIIVGSLIANGSYRYACITTHEAYF